MKKKTTKHIITYALVAFASSAFAVGTTFALFTDKSETNLTVGSAKVDVNTVAALTNVWEYNGTEAGLPVAIVENEAISSIGSTTKFEDGIFKLSKWAPGDKARISIDGTNDSNVKTKMRLKIVMTGDLADHLVIKAFAGEATTPEMAANGSKTLVSQWLEKNPGEQPQDYILEVSFPNHGTEITSREEGIDNQGQGKTAQILVTYEVVQGNAALEDSILEQANTILATNSVKDGPNRTMYDALVDLETARTGFKATVLGAGILYNPYADLFYEPASVLEGTENDYFKAYSNLPSPSEGYSIYANHWTGSGIVELDGIGFDVGDEDSFTSIQYQNTSSVSKENVIRTNSANTTLTINAASDTIHHYGTVGSLNIQSIANDSYHEFGRAFFAEIKAGRLVLEQPSSVSRIHIDKKDGEQSFNPITIVDEGGALPDKITRDRVSIPEHDAKLVVTVISSNSEEEVFVYPYTDAQGATGTTEKVTEGENKQNPDVNSPLGMLVLDNGGDAGEKANSNNQKDEQKESIINEAKVEEVEHKGFEVIHVPYLAPTCLEVGHSEYHYYMDGEDEVRIGYKQIAALGHDLVHHNAKAPTCTDVGWEAYDACSRCSYSTYEEIPPLGHEYAAPTYTWNADHSKCTATRVCSTDDSHVESETVDAVKLVTRAATCTLTELSRFTATFENSAFETQIETDVESAPALGHDYVFQNYSWQNPATGKLNMHEVCSHDSSHTKTTTVDSNLFVISDDVNAGTLAVASGFGLTEGESIEVTATPKGGATFVGWYSDSTLTTLVSVNNPFTFNMPSGSYHLYAKFESGIPGAKLVVDGSKYFLGMYPQDDVSAEMNELLNAAKTAGTITKDNTTGYYVYDGSYYAIANDNNWYKCSAIEWKRLAKSGNDLYVMAKMGLDRRIFDPSTNVWNNSQLKQWLESTFRNAAFSMLEGDYSSSIATLSIPTYEDLTNTSYYFNSDHHYEDYNRKCSATKYSIANGALTYTGFYGGDTRYWTSSLCEKAEYGENGKTVWIVYQSGSMTNKVVTGGNLCVRPVMHIYMPQ